MIGGNVHIEYQTKRKLERLDQEVAAYLNGDEGDGGDSDGVEVVTWVEVVVSVAEEAALGSSSMGTEIRDERSHLIWARKLFRGGRTEKRWRPRWLPDVGGERSGSG
ncbi:hypothetical protein Tco_0898931 [Tanacetum coccineum]